jgi:hypothetical protein
MASSVVVDVVVSIEVAAASLLVAEPGVERTRAVVRVVDAQSDLPIPAAADVCLGRADDCGTDALGPMFGRPHPETVEFRAI